MIEKGTYIYGGSMLKKIVAVLLVGLMLHPGYAFAQSSDNSEPSLQKLQEQAREAYEDVSNITNAFIEFLGPVGNAVLFGAIGVLVGQKLGLVQAEKILDILSDRMAEDLAEIVQYGNLLQFMHEESVGALSPTNLKEYEYLSATFNEVSSWPQDKVDVKGIKVLLQNDKNCGLHSYTETEMSAIASWISQVKKKPEILKSPEKLLGTLTELKKVSPSYFRAGSVVPRLLSMATLKKAGFLGVGLLLLSTTANAAPNDAKITKRIMNKPELFLKASAADLQEIEQNPMAEELCRTYANGLIQFNKLSDADKKAVVETVVKMSPQHRAKVDVTRSLRPVRAR